MAHYRFFPALCGLFSASLLFAQTTAPNNTLQGRVLYQSSGNKPAAGVRIAEPDANPAYSVDNGEYRLTFQTKRNGASLALEVGKDNAKGQKLELVNEKEIKAAKLPAGAEELLDIIVCPAGERDIAAQRYYRILRTTADRELEKKKKEVEGLVAQKEKNYQKISELYAQLDRMQAALDSAKIREQAFSIASINLDRASQMVKDAVRKIDEENDVEGALNILSAEALDTAYESARALKKKAETAIRQVVEGYEFKISLLLSQFRYREVALCYEQIAVIYQKEEYDEEELAEYFSKIALYWYENEENYQKQVEFNRKALAIREKILPAEHPGLASSYNNLGSSHDNLGEYQKALKMIQKAVDIQEKVQLVDRSFTVTYYSNLAVTYSHLGEYQKALEFSIKDIEISKKNLPADHPDLARSYNVLSGAYEQLGEYQKALEYNLKSLEIQENIFPAGHIDLAISYDNLAALYGNLGDFQKQWEFNSKAFAVYEKILPANHPHWAVAYKFRAKAYGDLGEDQKRLEYNLKALAINEVSLPADHPELARSYNNLAVAYGKLSDFQKQLEFNLKALAIIKNTLTADHPNLATSYNNLAKAYGDLGDYQKQLEFNLKSLVIKEKTLPENHPNLAISYSNLAVTYSNLNEHQKALEYNLRSLAIREKNLPSDHPDLAALYNNTAIKYGNTGDNHKKLEFNLKALAIREKTLPAEHPDLATSYNNTGLTYAKLRQFPEAKTYFEKYQAIGPSGRAYRNWALYHALQNDKLKAMENLQKAVDLGYNDLKWITTDESLEGIRDWAAYKVIVEQLQAQNPPDENTAPANLPAAADRAQENRAMYQTALDSNLTNLAIRQKNLPPDHPELGRLYNNIGYNYAKLRQFPLAKVYFEKFQAVNASGRVYRNWAMYHALQNDVFSALENLKKAVSLGYNDLKWIETDDSLENIRGEKGYRELVERLKKQ
ncbi:MAG: tetratricopeptide repeat protein [Lewinellaceae bacterium]|nr:tetratricopeptide repeat protein [Lewinellaceae bacterium]